jgi:hypothetical protein
MVFADDVERRIRELREAQSSRSETFAAERARDEVLVAKLQDDFFRVTKDAADYLTSKRVPTQPIYHPHQSKAEQASPSAKFADGWPMWALGDGVYLSPDGILRQAYLGFSGSRHISDLNETVRLGTYSSFSISNNVHLGKYTYQLDGHGWYLDTYDSSIDGGPMVDLITNAVAALASRY